MTLNFTFFLILAGGWVSGKFFTKIKLPGVLGMTIFGVVISSFSTNIPDSLWEIAPFLKSMALIVILLRAGLGIKRSVLNKIGKTALLLGFIPCIFEAIGLTLLFYYFTDFNLLTSGLTGVLLSAVSPAVVVPSMLDLKNKGYGEKKEVPTIILAGASLDDVFVITIFTLVLGILSGESNSIPRALLSIPVSLLGGAGIGLILGFLASFYFNKNREKLLGADKLLLLLAFSLFFFEIGNYFHLAALLGVMVGGFIILEKAEPVAHESARHLKYAWVFAEIVLFVLIGLSVDVTVALNAGIKGVFIIFGGLIIRSLGVFIGTINSGLNLKERLFCIISYIPKATVQAALGGIALERGLPYGEEILAYAVLAIIITAPLGLLGINLFGKKLLN
jgi:solute carrier family 9B (sodium/hydrogen exchanger), member 1/2